MACTGTYKIRGIRLEITVGASTNTSFDYYYRSPLHELADALAASIREDKARQRLVWKEPKKCRPVLTVPVIRRYEKMFTGRNFPVGGPKK